MTELAEPLNRSNMNGVGSAIGQVARNRELIIELQKQIATLGSDDEEAEGTPALSQLLERLGVLERKLAESVDNLERRLFHLENSTVLQFDHRLKALENPPKRKPGRPRKHPKPEDPQQEASA